jgi:flagellar basal-body rod protein FlgB
MFDVHFSTLCRALDKTTGRLHDLFENAANWNTPHYKRKDRSFNVELEDAQRASIRCKGHRDELSQVMTDANAIRFDGNNVDLEREIVAIIETDLRHNMLTEFATRYFKDMRNIIREGK